MDVEDADGIICTVDVELREPVLVEDAVTVEVDEGLGNWPRLIQADPFHVSPLQVEPIVLVGRVKVGAHPVPPVPPVHPVPPMPPVGPESIRLVANAFEYCIVGWLVEPKRVTCPLYSIKVGIYLAVSS